MAGTGKSTLTKKLSKNKLKCYSGGDALEELVRHRAITCHVRVGGRALEGLKFKERSNDPKFDKAVDAKLLKYAAQGNVLLDSWTMPWLLKGGFGIRLMASMDKRAARVAERDKITG